MLFINSSTEIGFPSALQNEVEIICFISRSFPSRNFILSFCMGGGTSHTHGFCPHTTHGAVGGFTHTQGVIPHAAQGCFGAGSTICSSMGSPPHSGSAK